MRTSASLIAATVIVLGFGFGHAGCYQSGIPGGSGAGGAQTVTGIGGRDSGNPDAGEKDGGATDSGTGSEIDSGSPTGGGRCLENADCHDVTGKPKCAATSGACVECETDEDCRGGTDPGANDSSIPSPHCVQNICRTYRACDYVGKCSGGGGLCNQDLPQPRCVQCIENVDCSTSGTTCAGTLCRQVCSTANACPDTSPVCLKVGTSGICTERCKQDADCALGYKCTQAVCNPT